MLLEGCGSVVSGLSLKASAEAANPRMSDAKVTALQDAASAQDPRATNNTCVGLGRPQDSPCRSCLHGIQSHICGHKTNKTANLYAP